MTHLVWDWNGTLLDDLTLVVDATNACLALFGAGPTTAEEHRREFRRPVAAYYELALGRAVDEADFARLDRVFHETYGNGLSACALAADAHHALASWPGTQSLLSMWFHDRLVPTIDRYGLAGYFVRVDGLRAEVGGGPKTPHLVEHLDALGVAGSDCVLVGDSVDDAGAAAAVGAACVLYSGGFTDVDRLRATGRPVAHTLTEAVQLALSLPGTPAPRVPGGAAPRPVADPAW